MVKKVSMFTPTSCINISFNEGLWSRRVQFWGWSPVKFNSFLVWEENMKTEMFFCHEEKQIRRSRNRGQWECSISSSRVGRYQNYQDGAVSNQLTDSIAGRTGTGESILGVSENITVIVPVVYMELAVMSLMRANPWDFFGPWNGNEPIECHLAKKVEIFRAHPFRWPASKSLRPAFYKQQVH